MVDVALSRYQENPQLIFESMNSTGRELSQADPIRNYVLMGQPPELQEQLYTLHWRPMEQAFGQEAYSCNEFSAFMRDFLTVKTAEVPRLDLVYEVSSNTNASRPLLMRASRPYCAISTPPPSVTAAWPSARIRTPSSRTLSTTCASSR